MALSSGIETALLSDVGRVRKNNEDAVGEEPQIGLLVLADGMGGYQAGEVASRMAVATILKSLRSQAAALRNLPAGEDPSGRALRQAIETAHGAIHRSAKATPEHAGMGTTVVACLLHEGRITTAYVGDSRLYRLRGGELRQLTRDHSLIEELIARGHYSREDAQRKLSKNIVTRALGVEGQVQVDVIESELAVGDLYLLCSDGLTDMLDDAAIGLTLTRFADNLSAAARALVDQANDNGGRDNISVALARVDAPPGDASPWYQRLVQWI